MTNETLHLCPVCGHELSEQPTSDSQGFICSNRFCQVELNWNSKGSLIPTSFQLHEDFTYLLLPFTFEVTSENNPYEQVRQSERWISLRYSLDDQDDRDRTEYFMPYLRRYLFPELFEEETSSTSSSRVPQKPPAEEPSCQRYVLDLKQLDSTYIPSESAKGIPCSVDCHDTRNHRQRTVPFLLKEVSLILFNYRVGFLKLQLQTDAEYRTLFDQADVAAFLRFIVPIYKEFQLPTISMPTRDCQVPHLVQWLLQEFGSSPQLHKVWPDEMSESQDWPVKLVYDDRMLIYSYSCLKQTSLLKSNSQTVQLIRRTSPVSPESEPDAFWHSVKNEHSDYWLKHRWEGFSKDGGSLIAFDSNAYHRDYLGIYHGTYYFDIFLLAALQRVTLLSLFERMADINKLTKSGKEGRNTLRRLRYDLLLFKNQCWFSQITNRERGLELWQQWQETFETKTLLGEVNEQSEELDNFLSSRNREFMEQLFRIVGFLTVAIPAVFGLDVLFKDQSWAGTLKWILFLLLISGSGVYALYLYYKQREI